jgi:hypothetical protein
MEVSILNTQEYVEQTKNKLQNIIKEEFAHFNFTYEDKILEKKLCNENTMEFKKYQVGLKKKAKIEKNKPANIAKQEYETVYNIDILEDDIFNNIDETKIDDEKIDFENMTRDVKLKLITDFLHRKNIILSEEDLKKIDELIDNPDVNIKKYLNISKLYQQVIKISFIKKLENGSYVVDLSENKIKKSKKFFLK